ncbi:MAG: glycosyltransferase family 4 protein [Planctomycetaceae bacterium]|jgi:glycosyltransferase involved in cell wall biosynthesis|nr:glycosyltransferase family 4 protein [Planctomycetaceae bacterium]
MDHPRVLVPVLNPLGGIRTYMLYNLNRLHNEGYRFTFLSGAGGAFDTFKQDLADWEDTEFMEFPPGRNRKMMFSVIRRTLRERSFRLIHSQGLQMGTITAAANFFRRVPHLITLHNVIVPGNEVPGRFKYLKERLISFLTQRTTAIIAVSNDCLENHIERFPAWQKGPVKLHVIVNGVDTQKLLRSQSDFETAGTPWIRALFGEKSDVFIGGFFGRFMPEKGFETFLQALTILAARGYKDRIRFVVTRERNGYLKESIQAVEENPHIAGMIQFIEPFADIAPILAQIDLLVNPSLYEACPILPMEAMVLGKPVIGSDCIGLREVLYRTPSAAPKKGDADALAANLIDFIEQPAVNAAKNFAEEAKNRFDVRIATDKLLELYQQYRQ